MTVPAPIITGYASDAGILASDAKNAGVLTLIGTATAWSRVHLFDGTRLLGTAAVDDRGMWGFTTPVLGTGSFAVSLKAVEVAPGAASAPSIALDLAIAAPARTVAPLADVVAAEPTWVADPSHQGTAAMELPRHAAPDARRAADPATAPADRPAAPALPDAPERVAGADAPPGDAPPGDALRVDALPADAAAPEDAAAVDIGDATAASSAGSAATAEAPDTGRPAGAVTATPGSEPSDRATIPVPAAAGDAVAADADVIAPIAVNPFAAPADTFAAARSDAVPVDVRSDGTTRDGATPDAVTIDAATPVAAPADQGAGDPVGPAGDPADRGVEAEVVAAAGDTEAALETAVTAVLVIADALDITTVAADAEPLEITTVAAVAEALGITMTTDVTEPTAVTPHAANAQHTQHAQDTQDTQDTQDALITQVTPDNQVTPDTQVTPDSADMWDTEKTGDIGIAPDPAVMAALLRPAAAIPVWDPATVPDSRAAPTGTPPIADRSVAIAAPVDAVPVDAGPSDAVPVDAVPVDAAPIDTVPDAAIAGFTTPSAMPDAGSRVATPFAAWSGPGVTSPIIAIDIVLPSRVAISALRPDAEAAHRPNTLPGFSAVAIRAGGDPFGVTTAAIAIGSGGFTTAPAGRRVTSAVSPIPAPPIVWRPRRPAPDPAAMVGADDASPDGARDDQPIRSDDTLLQDFRALLLHRPGVGLAAADAAPTDPPSAAPAAGPSMAER